MPTFLLKLLPLVTKYWKYAVMVGLALALAVTAVYASNRKDEVDTLNTKYTFAQQQLTAQSESIKQLTELQDKVSEQMIYREQAKKLFSEQADAILGELDALKESHEKYAMCAESNLPYRLDSMFDGSPGVSDEDSGTDASGGVSEQDASAESTSDKQRGQEHVRRLREVSD